MTISGGGLGLAEGLKGRPIEFSEPRHERGKTESSTLLPGQSRLDQLESDLASPFKSFVPGKSLDGMMMTAPLPLPVPPSVPGPRARELDNNKRDWMFRTPEELFSIQTMADKYKAPELTSDGRDQKDVRPMERAYMNVLEATWSAMGTNAPAERAGGLYDPRAGRLQDPLANPLPGTASELENNVRRAFGGNAGFGSSRSTDAADFFKFNNGQIPNKPTEAQMQRTEAYMRILDFNNALPDATTASGGAMESYQSPFASPYVNRAFFDPPKPAAPASSPLGGGLNGSPGNSTFTPSWSTPVTPPAPEPVRVTPPSSSPFFNSPRPNF